MDEQAYSTIISARATERYREEQVNGLSQKDLILMLYDGAIKFAEEAKTAIEKKDFALSYQRIVRARDIVTELLRILNPEAGGEVAENLKRLYVHIIGRLIEANLTRETRFLDNVTTILKNLRAAWAELDFDAALAAAGQSKRDGNGNHPKTRGHRQLVDQSCLLSVTA